MPVSGLDSPCAVCGRRSGSHTLDEWAECLGVTTLDLPFETMPKDATAREAAEAAEAVRRQFQLDEDLLVADHVVCKALVLTASSGAVSVASPAVLHEFALGTSHRGAPVTVAKVLYAGDPDTVRKYGQLVRDSANGAANAAERA